MNNESATFIHHKTKQKFFEATANDINNACEKAYKAFLEYRNFSGKTKAAFLEEIANDIEANRTELLQTAMQETSLLEARLNGEITRTINQIKLFAGLLNKGSWVNAIIDTAQPERKPLPKPDIRQMQRPIGVVAVFGASNFPFAFSTAGGDTIAALAAGCAVVYKSHPAHPALTEMVAAIIIDAIKKTSMPDDIFSMLQSSNNETATQLVQHPLIKAIAFTGSFKGGKSIYDAAAKRSEPIPVYAEMGSTNPVFILPGILKEKGEEIAKALAASNLLSAGQFCTNPGIIITSNQKENFTQQFASVISNANGEAMLTDSIHTSYKQNIKQLEGSDKTKLYAKGILKDELSAQPNLFTASAENFINNHELHEEVFGPFSLHINAESNDELMKIAESLQGQLTLTIWGNENDLQEYSNLINYLELKAGRLIINSVPTGVEVTHAMMHGGPFPATTDSKFTSVGTTSIYRFTRPVCYQNFNNNLLPQELRDDNPLRIIRTINGEQTLDAVK